jgi:hypothetical protein
MNEVQSTRTIRFFLGQVAQKYAEKLLDNEQCAMVNVSSGITIVHCSLSIGQ